MSNTRRPATTVQTPRWYREAILLRALEQAEATQPVVDPTPAPVVTPPATVTITKRTLHALIGAAAGATALLVFALGVTAAGGSMDATTHQSPAKVASTSTPKPAATQDQAVTSFNDGWDTGLQDVQEMWQDDHQRVGQCLSEAKPTELHSCLSNTK